MFCRKKLPWFSLHSVYIKCSKWCPFIRMHARSRFLRSSMASSMMAWLKCDHRPTSTRRCFNSSANGCSWYSAVLLILMVNYKWFTINCAKFILFTMLDFCESYAAQRACPIFWYAVYRLLDGGMAIYTTTLPLEVFTQRNSVPDFIRLKLNFIKCNKNVAFWATLWGTKGTPPSSLESPWSTSY